MGLLPLGGSLVSTRQDDVYRRVRRHLLRPRRQQRNGLFGPFRLDQFKRLLEI